MRLSPAPVLVRLHVLRSCPTLTAFASHSAHNVPPPFPVRFYPSPRARRGATDAYGDDEARKAAVLFGVTIAIFILTGAYYQFIDPMATDYWNLHRIVDSGYSSKLALTKQHAVERANALEQHTFAAPPPPAPVAAKEASAESAFVSPEAAEATRLLREAFASTAIVSTPPELRQE